MRDIKVSNLLEREVSRSEFLKYIGVAFIGIFGITAFIKGLHEHVPAQTAKMQQPTARAGYGGSAYGR